MCCSKSWSRQSKAFSWTELSASITTGTTPFSQAFCTRTLLGWDWEKHIFKSLGVPNAWVRAAKASRFSYKLWNLNFNQAQQCGSRWDRETQHHKVFNHLYDKYLVFLLKYCNTLFWDSIKNYNRFAIRLYSRWFSTLKKELCLI